MKKEISCSTCAEIIGTLEKNLITEADEILYRQMVTCPNGHTEVALVEPTLDAE